MTGGAGAQGQQEVLLFADGQGNYYQIPRAVLEQGRVPDDQKAQLEQALNQDDTSGFVKIDFLKIQPLSGLKLVGTSNQDSSFSWGLKHLDT